MPARRLNAGYAQDTRKTERRTKRKIRKIRKIRKKRPLGFYTAMYDVHMDMDREVRTERTMRAMRTVLNTLNVLNERVNDPETVDDRVDLMLLSEDITAAAQELTLRTREIAWRDVGPFMDPDPLHDRDEDDDRYR